MSHSRERKEKICLNCNTELIDRFCHHCGQENIEPKESFWHLVTHFFNDITHFDGKFFTTVGLLFRRPGFLSREYMAGRRMRYLNPVRMYVFTSALFFLVFFSLFNVKKINLDLDETSPKDSVLLAQAAAQRDSISSELGLDSSALKKFSARMAKSKKGNNRKEYDSIQASLPEAKRDSWLTRQFAYREFKVREEYKGSWNEFGRELLDKFLHTFPYLLFVSLPLYALYLKLLYIRNKQFYYADHGIFLVHLYVFTFLLLLPLFALVKLQDSTDWGIWGWMEAALLIYGIYYAWKAMKNFYLQGRRKTIGKFILFNFLSFISIVFLFVLFIFITFFRV